PLRPVLPSAHHCSLPQMPPCTFHCLFLLLLPPPPRSTLFPYTTLFRSRVSRSRHRRRTRRPKSPPRRTPRPTCAAPAASGAECEDRKSTRLNSSHVEISYAVFCLKKKKQTSHTYFKDAHAG